MQGAFHRKRGQWLQQPLTVIDWNPTDLPLPNELYAIFDFEASTTYKDPAMPILTSYIEPQMQKPNIHPKAWLNARIAVNAGSMYLKLYCLECNDNERTMYEVFNSKDRPQGFCNSCGFVSCLYPYCDCRLTSQAAMDAHQDLNKHNMIVDEFYIQGANSRRWRGRGDAGNESKKRNAGVKGQDDEIKSGESATQIADIEQ